MWKINIDIYRDGKRIKRFNRQIQKPQEGIALTLRRLMFVSRSLGDLRQVNYKIGKPYVMLDHATREHIDNLVWHGNPGGNNYIPSTTAAAVNTQILVTPNPSGENAYYAMATDFGFTYNTHVNPTRSQTA